MTIYVDEIRHYGSKGQWCHMWTDGTDAELDTFAARLGLKLSWSHTSQGLVGRFYHYDLRPSLRVMAVKWGATEIALSEWIKAKRKDSDC